MAEAVAAHRAGIVEDELRLVFCDLDPAVLVGVHRQVAVIAVLLFLGFDQRLEAVRLFQLALVGGDDRREHAGQRVHLMAAQLGSGLQERRLAGEHALKAEHEREAHAPLVRRLVVAGVDLRQGFVQGTPASGAGGEHLGRLLVRPQEGLSGPAFGALGIRRQARRLCGCLPLF